MTMRYNPEQPNAPPHSLEALSDEELVLLRQRCSAELGRRSMPGTLERTKSSLDRAVRNILGATFNWRSEKKEDLRLVNLIVDDQILERSQIGDLLALDAALADVRADGPVYELTSIKE